MPFTRSCDNRNSAGLRGGKNHATVILDTLTLTGAPQMKDLCTFETTRSYNLSG